jgi:hypothetical protein
MKDKEQEKVLARTFLINSTQLQDLMRYLMTRPYAEVVVLMNMISTLNQLDPSIGADFVKKQTGETNGKK